LIKYFVKQLYLKTKDPPGNSSGSFYVVAPPGNYTIYAKKLAQVVYSGISEFGDFLVLNNTVLNLNGNINGNIIINTQNPTPSPTIAPTNPSPAPTQTPTSQTSTPTPTSTPTVPELNWLAIIPLLLSVFAIAVVMRRRKNQVNKPEQIMKL
jgi:hypothetical protein